MIPVLGVPILNQPHYLAQMLRSVDVPVERLVVVDNGGVWEGEAIRPGTNLGVAASWNLILKATPHARWWAIVNFDLIFGDGDLARLAEHMDAQGGFAMLRDMAAFALTPDVVDRVGFFDENFHPAYCEDIDYLHRCRLADVPIACLPTRLSHFTSATYRSSDVLTAENARTYPDNAAYYARKWGGPMGTERYRTPFDRGGHVGDWRLERERISRLAWAPDPALALPGTGGDDGARTLAIGAAVG